MRRTLACWLLCASWTCGAQSPPTPTDALAGALPGLCAGSPRAELAARCAELQSGRATFAAAAAGQRLEEIPGQARAAGRDQDDVRPDASLEATAARWDLWAAFADGQLERREGRIEAGFDADRQNAALGVTWRPAADWTLDAGWQRVRETLDYAASDGVARTRIDGPLVVAQWAPGEHWSVEAQALSASGRLELTRAIRYALTSDGFNATARAAPRTQRRSLGLALRRSDSVGAWQLGTGLAADRADVRINAYTEQGGRGWALALGERRVRTGRARLEGSAARVLSTAHGVFVPRLDVALVREFDDPQRSVAVRLADDGAGTPVRFLTQEPDRTWSEWGLGLAWVRPGGHSGFIEWRGRLGHRFLDDRQIAIGWRIER